MENARELWTEIRSHEMLRHYLNQATLITSTTAYDNKGKPNGLEYMVQLGKSKTNHVNFDGGLPYIWDVETSELLTKRVCPELEAMTERLSLQEDLPSGCIREDGFYQLGTTTARVVNRDSGSRKVCGVFVLAPSLQAMKELWQALLNGTIRPERPLFNKTQQGPSYSELSATVAEMTPQLRHAMLRLGEAESIIIHLNAVVRSCGDVLAQQQSLIDRAIDRRDAVVQALELLRGEIQGH